MNRVSTEMFRAEYGEVFQGDRQWSSLPVPRATSTGGTRTRLT